MDKNTNSKNPLRLLISCPDRPGIVNEVSKFIFDIGGNIVDSQQYSMGLNARFFMRLCIVPSEDKFKVPSDKLQEALRETASKFQMEYRFHQKRKKMALMVSKYNHCLYDILLRQQYGEIELDIPVVISNHPDLKYITDSFKVPYKQIPIDPNNPDRMAAKIEQEEEIIKILKSYEVDFIGMARYMQILTPLLINEYPCKIINVHHGFLPAFKGARPYHQAYEKGVKIIGATAHYATEDLDMGPIISQGVLDVGHRDTVDDYIAKGRDIEKVVFAKAIRAHTEDKVIVYQNRTVVFD
jgi:formyltetrahydrofolate deformylase